MSISRISCAPPVMEASTLAGKFGVNVVRMSDSVTERSKLSALSVVGAVVQVELLGVVAVVGVVGVDCAANGRPSEQANTPSVVTKSTFLTGFQGIITPLLGYRH